MTDALTVGNLSLSGGLARLTGSSSKLDTEALVAAAYAAKRQPAVRLEQRTSRNEAKLAAFAEFKGLLGALKDRVDGLRNPPGLLGRSANLFEAKQAYLSGGGGVAPEQLLGVTVANEASPGSFAVSVERLATAHKLAARSVGAGQTLAEAWNGGTGFSGRLTLGLAGAAKTEIAVDGSMGVQDLRAAINAVSASTGITASVLVVGVDDQRLVLTAADTGRPIELADAGGVALTGMLGTTELQPAQTARILVDGVTVERSANRIGDLLPGIVLDLYQAQAGTAVTVQVEPALGAAKAQIAGFVEAYNTLRDFADRQGAVSDQGEVAEGAALFGDRTLRALTQTLATLVGTATPGLDAGTLRTLRDVGISLAAGGRLQLDESLLTTRLATALPELRRVFEFTATTSSPELAVYARTNALTDTSFRVVISDADADGRPEAATIDGVPAELGAGTIRGGAGTPYAGLKLIWTGHGDATIDVAVSQGVADRLYNALDEALASDNGPLEQAMAHVRAENAANARQIARIDDRATAARERLIARFTAMESALSAANAMLEQIRSQMDAYGAQN